MPARTIINQNLLFKVSKSSPFHIKSKSKLQKTQPNEKPSKYADEALAADRKLELCVSLIQSQLRKEPQGCKDFLERIGRLLADVKSNWQSMGWHAIEPEIEFQDYPFNRGMHKSSSKFLGKNKREARGDSEQSEGPFFTEKGVMEIKKKKLLKIAHGKQNGELEGDQQYWRRSRAKIGSKAEQTQGVMGQEGREVYKLKEQLQNLLESNQRLRKQKESLWQERKGLEQQNGKLNQQKKHWDQQKRELRAQIQRHVSQKLEYASVWTENSALQQNLRQMMAEKATLLDCLREREKEIVAIWQLQVF